MLYRILAGISDLIWGTITIPSRAFKTQKVIQVERLLSIIQVSCFKLLKDKTVLHLKHPDNVFISLLPLIELMEGLYINGVLIIVVTHQY